MASKEISAHLQTFMQIAGKGLKEGSGVAAEWFKQPSENHSDPYSCFQTLKLC